MPMNIDPCWDGTPDEYDDARFELADLKAEWDEDSRYFATGVVGDASDVF
jgi:hypothetical protein